MSGLVELEVEFVGETDLAIWVSDGDRRVSLPKSRIKYDADQTPDGQLITVEIQAWLAEQKGLV